MTAAPPRRRYHPSLNLCWLPSLAGEPESSSPASLSHWQAPGASGCYATGSDSERTVSGPPAGLRRLSCQAVSAWIARIGRCAAAALCRVRRSGHLALGASISGLSLVLPVPSLEFGGAGARRSGQPAREVFTMRVLTGDETGLVKAISVEKKQVH
jgi:hypothetical protein